MGLDSVLFIHSGLLADLHFSEKLRFAFPVKPEVISSYIRSIDRSFGFVFSPLCSRGNVCIRVRLFFFI